MRAWPSWRRPEANLKYLSGLLGAQTISYDKVNQLRHVRFLQDKAHVLELMQRHAAILRPKFEAVLAALRGIAPLGIASWTEPKGGYFVSCDAMPGTAKRTLALCAEAGVTMTPAGATYPGRERPRRQQHPHRAELPARGGAGAGHADLLPRPAHGRFGKARALIITAAPHNYIFGLSRIFFAECSR